MFANSAIVVFGALRVKKDRFGQKTRKWLSDHGLHCFLYYLHLSDVLLYDKKKFFSASSFYDFTVHYFLW